MWPSLVLCFLAMAAAVPAQRSQQPIGSVDLPAFPLAVAEADGWIVVSLGLSGAAFVPASAWDAPQDVLIREQWQTLSTYDLPGPGMLLAGRDGIIRHVISDPPGSEPVLISQFPGEGVPNQVLLEGDRLILASGGAGLSLWDWPDRTEAPTLRGRYPFVEFARRMAIEPGGERLFLADSLGGRVAVLDISDAMRPRLEESYPVASFCDSVEVGPNYLLFTDRNAGTFIARRAPETLPGNLWLLHQEFPLINPYQERMDVKRALLVESDESFFLCEAESGVRQFRKDIDTRRFREVARFQTRGAAIDAAVVPSGHLVVADHPNGLSLFRLSERR